MTQELYHPMRWFNWLNLRPFAQFRHTAYSKGAQQQAPQFRQAGGGGIELNTRLFRVFPIETNWLGLNIHKLRHIITPAVTYSYQGKPTIDSAQLRGSTLEKSNTVRPSIEQKFQTKRLVDGEWQKVDLARFITEIRYDLEGADGVGGEWNDLTMDLEAVPYDWLRVESDATIDPHIGKMTAFNADLVFRPNVGGLTTSAISAGEYSGKDNQYNELPWVLGLGWRYTRNTSSQLTMSTEFDLGPKWRIGYYHALDVKRFVTETSPTDSRVVKKIYDFADQQFRIRRDFHEWTAELIYGIERQEGETLLLLFRLKAFPDMPFEFQKGYHQPKAGRNFPKQ
ncbi:MAG: hypothetical protein COV76_04705 [Candidatus Omnitrophica bacterium CG11_big_fil_rev_8_21_14_0_20_64_10]|nr:MAG: hypothetical protein COV76_04705 [Candidatus Omnitrophica bacterium CG11_big_fil_rev_8_21_14_0_20_64_10]